jgi:hypothetical protein
MGNGAGVYQPRALEALNQRDIDEFDDIDRRCRRGYYQNHPEDYRQTLRAAIKNSRIDILETLLSCHDKSADIYPLHMAATYGVLECTELLITAGYSPTSVDSNGRSPLHCCAACNSGEAVICAEYLINFGKKALKMKDISGSTPLAIAVSRNHVEMVRLLLKFGSSLTYADKRGKTVVDLAKESTSDEIKSLLGVHPSSSAARTQAKVSSAIDEARIMQVWEKFFENAFLALEAESEYGVIADRGTFDTVTKRNAPKSPAMYSGELSDRDSRNSGREPSMLAEDAVSWFDWVLCPAGAYSNEVDQYYVVCKQGYYTKWFSELADEFSYVLQSDRGDLRLESFSGIESSEKQYPMTCEEAFLGGWITFFDEDANECYWMQLSTGRCERYLPLGDDTENVINLGLEFYEMDSQWVRPNQYPCSTSWIVVSIIAEESELWTDVADGKDHDDYKMAKDSSYKNSEKYDKGYDGSTEYDGYIWNYDTQLWEHQYPYEKNTGGGDSWYFYNTFTAQSRWEKPIGWDNQVTEEWNGWWLCRDHESGQDYWY